MKRNRRDMSKADYMSRDFLHRHWILMATILCIASCLEKHGLKFKPIAEFYLKKESIYVKRIINCIRLYGFPQIFPGSVICLLYIVE